MNDRLKFQSEAEKSKKLGPNLSTWRSIELIFRNINKPPELLNAGFAAHLISLLHQIPLAKWLVIFANFRDDKKKNKNEAVPGLLRTDSKPLVAVRDIYGPIKPSSANI